MEGTYLLPIVGVLVEQKDPKLKEAQFTYNDFLLHLHAAKDYPIIKLLIDSKGGYVTVSDKIIEKLKSLQKQIYATNVGMVASAAVSVFLAAPKENRTYNPIKGVFHPHNPWTKPEGDADYLSLVAKELKKTENKIVSDYSNATGVETEIMAAFLQQDIDLTPEQVEQLGFATIIKPEFKAVAMFNYKKENEMTEKEVGEKLTGIEKILNKFMAMLPKAKCLLVQDVNGIEIDFGSDIAEQSQIVVGVKATIAGAPATGEAVLADGTIVKFGDGGVVSEIVLPVEEGNPEMEALRAENEALKAELEASKTAQAQAMNESTQIVNELKNEVMNFKALYSKGAENVAVNVPAAENGTKTGFSFKRK